MDEETIECRSKGIPFTITRKRPPGIHALNPVPPKQLTFNQDGKQRNCYYCDGMLNHKDRNSRRFATRDHYIPKSRGGSNGRENIVIACIQCNQEKDNMMPNEFIHYLRIVRVYHQNDILARRRHWNEYIKDHIIAALYPQ